MLLAAFCAFVVGSVDNILRPRLVGRDTKMHDLVILFSILGGILTFGPIGFIIGPIIAGLFVTSWSIFDTAYHDVIREEPVIHIEESSWTGASATLWRSVGRPGCGVEPGARFAGPGGSWRGVGGGGYDILAKAPDGVEVAPNMAGLLRSAATGSDSAFRVISRRICRLTSWSVARADGRLGAKLRQAICEKAEARRQARQRERSEESWRSFARGRMILALIKRAIA